MGIDLQQSIFELRFGGKSERVLVSSDGRVYLTGQRKDPVSVRSQHEGVL